MSEAIAERILAELNQPTARVLPLLQMYRGPEYEAAWRQDVRLYRAFGRKLISAGHPTRAFELLRNGLSGHPADHTLEYLTALALARGGNISRAESCCTALMTAADLDSRLRVETLSLLGRLFKDRFQRTDDAEAKLGLARESARLYGVAHELSGDYFPCINAATMSLLAGELAQARELAQQVLQLAGAEEQGPGRGTNYWLLATLGEAHLLMGHVDRAHSWYQKAIDAAAGKLGDLASMRRQVQLLKHRVEGSQAILELFAVGSVVVFAGHMIDHPGRQTLEKLPARFPVEPELEKAVAAEIRDELERLQATVGYSSAACGSDLLFAEQMVLRGAELHLILPFNQQDFRETSVDFGLAEMASWWQRYEEVVKAATEVHFATRESYLGDAVLFEFGNAFIQGLALARAAELDVEPQALVVLEPGADARLGGAAQFADKWTAMGHPARFIDLAALRRRCGTGARPATVPEAQAQAGRVPRSVKREVKVMLFADVKNFSKLSEEQTPSFYVAFLDLVDTLIQAARNQPVFCNTWGDGLFLVFNHVVDGAAFALGLLDQFQRTNWEHMGLPPDTTVRIGMHAGPVFPHWDQLLARQNFFGSHVNRAARIEPVTMPGCAFTSEQFAALLAVEPGHDFVCEYLGVEALGKAYDRCALYRLDRKSLAPRQGT